MMWSVFLPRPYSDGHSRAHLRHDLHTVRREIDRGNSRESAAANQSMSEAVAALRAKFM